MAARTNLGLRAPGRDRTTTVATLATLALLALAGCGDVRDLGPRSFTLHEPPSLVFDEGDIVASLELALPETETFVVRATVPLPRGVYPRADLRVPFQVYNRNSGTFDAQVEIVSRYPALADGADVVEVLARVVRPAINAPGERVDYHVVYQPSDPAPFASDAGVEALLATPGALVMRSRDVFHNRYSSDLWTDARAANGSLRVLRAGVAADQRATHSSLLPDPAVAGPTGTLPHAFGVHAYLTRWRDEPFFSLDLRIHNAFSGKSDDTPADDALRRLWFEDLELVL